MIDTLKMRRRRVAARISPFAPPRVGRAAVLALVVFSAGCMRRTVITSGFGLFGTRQSSPRARSIPTTPDQTLRQTMQQQVTGAFDPLTDDRRVRTLESRLRLHPLAADVRIQLAAIYEGYGLGEEAMDQYSQALKDASAAPGIDPALAETAATGVGRCARAAGRHEEAVAVLLTYLNQFPSPRVWNELGLLYDDAGNLAGGEHALRQAIGSDPGNSVWHNNLGYNLLLQNKLDAAATEFRSALESNPKSATARNNLGVVLARERDLDAAYREFRQAAPDDATAHNNLAVALIEAGQYKQGREEIVRALAARHYFAPALANFKLVQELLRRHGKDTEGSSDTSAGIARQLPQPVVAASPPAGP
jgi:Flp pilus assembly protein TadD